MVDKINVIVWILKRLSAMKCYEIHFVEIGVEGYNVLRTGVKRGYLVD